MESACTTNLPFLAHNVELMLDEMVDKAADNEADKMVEEVAEIER